LMRHYSKEELEELLKEKSDQYLLYPSDNVWKSIQRELHPRNGWLTVSFAVLLLLASVTAIWVKKETHNNQVPSSKPTAYQFVELPSVIIRSSISAKSSLPVLLNQTEQKSALAREIVQVEKNFREEDSPMQPPIQLTAPKIGELSMNIAFSTPSKIKENRTFWQNALASVVQQAKKIGKSVSWQVYVTPSWGYRKLEGEASLNSYQYSVYSYSTNAPLARNVKDAVNHRPGMGFEAGMVMFYPINKRLSLKAGFQANYHQYGIDAYSGYPEMATYAMNNAGSYTTPINAVSIYRNDNGNSHVTLRNEHYMFSVPIGLDYRVAGNDNFNFSVASTIQPTYVFANYSYLISSNLRNYAKEPSLNRKLNINTGLEANVNFTKGSYKWSIGPQFRYQLLSSFKDKYPIRENLTDLGIRIGLIRTIN
jgi:hypothetical protein